ncbi:MAG: hypothetical protein RL705_634 [Bacteroidota bacterium]|jgi:predicted KAP-like P-loop ATPase
MKIKHNEIEIDSENPFSNCKLDRQKFSNVLTGIINSYSEGFVMAINNKWGTGKTTFIRMWEQDLKNKKYQTVYFNAWENDFENNPLVALMGELKTLTNKKTEPEFKNTLKKAATLSKQILPVIAQAVADKYIDTKEIKDLINGVTKGIADVFENDVNEYATKKKSIIEFRKSLSTFIANTNEGRPIVFIIDELDRCRPNYAVSILEQIKHFFSVPNIVFVLSIDKVQLGNAVRGVYGSDRIDADEYLKRFIDIEYSIPEPEKNVYNKYLYDYFRFDEFLEKVERKNHFELNADKKVFLEVSEILFSNSSITLRQQEKIFSHSRLALRSFTDKMYLIPEVFLFLIYIKVMNEEFYNKIKFKQISIEELQISYYEIVKDRLNNDEDRIERLLMWLEAYLVLYYNNYLQHYNRKNKIYERDSTTDKNKLLINSSINKEKNDAFLSIFENIDRSRSSGGLDYGHFFKRIDLTEPLIS